MQKLYKNIFKFIAILFLLTSCDTMRGVTSYHNKTFPRLSSKQCIREALEKSHSVDFIKREKQISKAHTITLKEVTTDTYTFFYKIKDKKINPERDWTPYVKIEESYGDLNNKEASFTNHYASIFGPLPSEEEKIISKSVIREINEGIWKKCGLQIKQPLIKVY